MRKLYYLLLLTSMVIPIDCFARAGGASDQLSIWQFIIFIIFMPFFLLYGWYVNRRINSKTARVERVLSEIAKTEPQWAEEKLLATARESFLALQQAWSEQDLTTLKKYLHPDLYPSWEIQIQTQIKNQQKNLMTDVMINNMRIVDARNYLDDERDCFTVCIDASAKDQVINLNNPAKTTTKKSKSFREFWTFGWHQNQWLLLAVYQSNAWKRFALMDIVYEHN